MINFPDAPTNGQFYTPPGLSGSWKWDGQKWIASSETSSNYLPLTGGTLTGPLIIASDRISVKSAGDALAFLDKSTGATNQALLVGSRNGLNRWSVGVGTNETETGGNAGSNFGIASWDDAGGFLALPLKINRANSTATFSGNVGLGGYAVPSDTLNGTLMTGTNFATVGGGLSANIYGTSSAIWKYLGNGAGSLIASNGAGGWDWYTAASGTAGAVATITRTMRLDSNGNATLAGLYLYLNNSTGVVSGSGGPFIYGDANNILLKSLGGFLVQNATGATPLSSDSTGNLYITGATAQKPGGGSWVAPSDMQLKVRESVTAYTTGLDAITQLQPVTYQYNGTAGLPTDQTFHGLVADDVELVMPEAVGRAVLGARPALGDDEVDEPGKEYLTFDSTPLVYALVNAVKELAVRIDAIETALPPGIAPLPSANRTKKR